MLIYGIEAAQLEAKGRAGALFAIIYAKLTKKAPPLFSRLLNEIVFYLYIFLIKLFFFNLLFFLQEKRMPIGVCKWYTIGLFYTSKHAWVSQQFIIIITWFKLWTAYAIKKIWKYG